MFGGCTSLKSVVLPHSLKELPMHTFYDCSSLTDIVIPGNIKTIDVFCFSNCTSLKNVTMQVGVEKIGMNAFEGCESLDELTLPEGFTTLGDRPFENCQNLKKLVVPDTTVNFGYRVFDCAPGIVRLTVYCSKDSYVARYIAESNVSYRLADLEGDFFVVDGVLQRYFGHDSVVVVPDGVEYISYNVFWDSSNVTDLFIPESVKNIIYHWGSRGYFSLNITILCQASNLGVIKFCQEHSREYELIGEEAYIKKGVLIRYAGKDKIYHIPDDVSMIGPRAFQSCTSLEEVWFSDGVTDIEDEAFSGCTELRKVMLSRRIEKISGRCVFEKCPNLQHFEADGLLDFTYHIFRDCKRLCYFKMCPSDQIPECLKNETHMVPDIAKKEYSEEEMLAYSRIVSQYSLSHRIDYYGEEPRTYNWEWFRGIETLCDQFNLLDAVIQDGELVGFYVFDGEWTVVGTDQVGKRIMLCEEPDSIYRKNCTTYCILEKTAEDE